MIKAILRRTCFWARSLFMFMLFVDCACGCSQTFQPEYTCEVSPQKNGDEAERKELVCLLDKIVISKTSLTNVPVVKAIDWLAAKGHQTISFLNFTEADSTGTNSVVAVEMTDTAFLAVLDEICHQSSRYWGFKGRVLMTLPKSYVDSHQGEWIVRTGSHQIRPASK